MFKGRNHILLWVLVLISIVIIVIRIVFDKSVEWFSGGAILLDDVLFGLAMAIISSAIFYYLTVYLPRKADEENINRIMDRQLRWVVSCSVILVRDVCSFGGIKKEFDKIKKEDISASCKNIKLKDSKKTKIHSFESYEVTIAQFQLFYIKRIKNYISEVLPYSYWLDTELLLMLNEILHNSYFVIAEYYYNNLDSFPEPYMTSMDNDLFDYYERVVKLKKYCEKKLDIIV